jgi:beta-lactam-binding protein with PASTA domain
MVIIPDVRKELLQQAQQQLTALGLTVIVTNTPDQQPVDTILSISPAPGQTVATGTEVVVQISAGPAPSPNHQSSQETNEKNGKGKKNN